MTARLPQTPGQWLCTLAAWTGLLGLRWFFIYATGEPPTPEETWRLTWAWLAFWPVFALCTGAQSWARRRDGRRPDPRGPTG